MAINETIVTGKYFRQLVDKTNKKWNRYSFWNKAKDTEFEDGLNAETKLGAIKGITSNLNATDPNFAASITSVAELNDSLTASDNLKFRFATDGEGNYGYLGADDSFVPFNNKKIIALGQFPGTIDVKPFCNYYKNLTKDNFFPVVTSVSGNCYISSYGANVTYTNAKGTNIGVTYNASTGFVTVTSNGSNVVTKGDYNSSGYNSTLSYGCAGTLYLIV